MDTSDQRPELAWMPESAVEPRHLAEEAPAHNLQLSPAQKRDLLRMMGAALLSVAFFAMPLWVMRSSPTPVEVPAVIAADAAPVAVEISGHDALRSPVIRRNPGVRARATSAEPRLRARSTAPQPDGRPAPVREKMLLEYHEYHRNNRPAAVMRAYQIDVDDTRPLVGRGFVQKLGRVIVGDGRNVVRPFPTVAPLAN